jgi:hypothetical protein
MGTAKIVSKTGTVIVNECGRIVDFVKQLWCSFRARRPSTDRFEIARAGGMPKPRDHAAIHEIVPAALLGLAFPVQHHEPRPQHPRPHSLPSSSIIQTSVFREETVYIKTLAIGLGQPPCHRQ